MFIACVTEDWLKEFCVTVLDCHRGREQVLEAA